MPSVGAGLDVAADERGAFAHAVQAVPVSVLALVAVAGASPVVGDLELDPSGRYRTMTRAEAGPACCSALVSASCTIR